MESSGQAEPAGPAGQAGQAGPGEAAPGQVDKDEPDKGQADVGHTAAGHALIWQLVAPRLRAFLAFCYDFVVGDDWVIAIGVVAGLALTYAVSQTAIPAWWLMPVAVGTLLPVSLRRLTRRR